MLNHWISAASDHRTAASAGSLSLNFSRRTFLSALGATAASLSLRQTNAAPRPSNAGGRSYRLEGETTVTAGRLDAEVKKAFPHFNTMSVLPDFDATMQGARHDVVLSRIVTVTTLPETGEQVEVTGLLALPTQARGPIPVVSWQHGTILSFDQVPSNLTKLTNPDYSLSDERDSLETLLNVQRFAGNGFAVIAADYVGKGPLRNGRSEAYTVKGVTTQTCRDMLNAGLAAIREKNLTPGKLFLNGWSQGALNTQWLHQALRTEGVEIAATAVASPFNDLGEAWRYWTKNQTFPLPSGTDSYPDIPAWVPLCMIVLLGSYQKYYQLDGLIEAAVQPKYHSMALKFWNDYDAGSIDQNTFPASQDLLVPGFFDRFTDERNSAFLRHLAGNCASYWNYDSEIRFIYGLADEAIHPAMVSRALSAGGKNAIGVPVSRGNHRNTFLAGLYGDATSLDGRDNVLSWFLSHC